MAIANSIILVVSMLVTYTAAVLIYMRKSDKYFGLLLIIFVLSVGTGFVAIITDPSIDDPAVITSQVMLYLNNITRV